MRSDEIDYEIIGDDIQIVEIELDPGETVIAEAGAMNYMEDGITFTAKMGDGSNPNQGFFSKLGSVGKRMLTGESRSKFQVVASPMSGKIRSIGAGTGPPVASSEPSHRTQRMSLISVYRNSPPSFTVCLPALLYRSVRSLRIE